MTLSKGGTLITDKDRIDWLESRHWDVVCKLPKNTQDSIHWYVGADEAYTEFEGKTLREAIDAGIASEKGTNP